MPTNLYLYKSNQPRFWIEFCKKIRLPGKKLKSINLCLEYYKDIIIFTENDDLPKSDSDNDDNSWVDMKKFL